LRLGEKSIYKIAVSRHSEPSGGKIDISLDGVRQDSNLFSFVDDGEEHRVDVHL